jgi:hypothetical protein
MVSMIDIKKTINKEITNYLTLEHMNSGLDQRAFASELEKQFTDLAHQKLDNTTQASSVKSTDDVTIGGTLVDVKTTNKDGKFKMPNLISIDKLKKIFHNTQLLYSFVVYSAKELKVFETHSYYIWELPWNHLAIQNLGKGQLQIKSMKKFLDDINNFPKVSKDEWYKELEVQGSLFYQKLLKKTEKRLEEWNAS